MRLPLRAVVFWLGVFAFVRGLPAQSAAEAELQVEAPAMLATSEAPLLPAELKTELGATRVRLRLVIDEAGLVAKVRVLEGTDPRLEAPVLAAVKRWTFRAALSKGRPVAAGVDVVMPVVWSPAPKRKNAPPPESPVMVEPSPRKDSSVSFSPEGEYPETIRWRQISGEVIFKARLDREGKLQDIKVEQASHPDFVQPALATLAKWEFFPAMEGDLPVESKTLGSVKFDRIGANRAEVLAANRLTDPEGKTPITQPEPITLLDPVRPFDELLAGQAGRAVVVFKVSASGGVREIEMIEASDPVYGQALAAAVQRAYFLPSIIDGMATEARLRLEMDFPAVPEGAEDMTIGWQRVLRGLREKSVGSAQGLDEKLTPVSRSAPLYPAELLKVDRPSGEAQIELVIDRTGRVQLPRVISATHEAFGWAAATAASTWVFKAPRRGGEPVDVRVRVPFKFTPPEL